MRMFPLNALILLLLFASSSLVAANSSPFDDSVESQVWMLAGSESDEWFVKLGQPAAIVVCKTLEKDLSFPASKEGASAKVMMEVPFYEQGLISNIGSYLRLAAVAMEKMTLDEATKQKLSELMNKALKSPYCFTRGDAVSALSRGMGSDAVPNVLPLLNDPNEVVRVNVATSLERIGTADTALQMKKALDKRRNGLSEEQIKEDPVFEFGDKAVAQLGKKFDGEQR